MQSHLEQSTTADILKKVDRYLRKSGGRMTGVRREIVLKMAELGKPKTAYQILEAANKKRSTKLSAISLYRTLEFLIEAGVVLKLESKNAFELCLNGAPEHSHLIMVCDKCGQVREVHDDALAERLVKTAKKNGHMLKHHAIELHGVCSDC
ncbi:MAG: Fur family transcriptional regulator [Alphaproteobacteria bacterium]|nr:Fur family transcriptional regulator [Alphaproteobacteria bacterium]